MTTGLRLSRRSLIKAFAMTGVGLSLQGVTASCAPKPAPVAVEPTKPAPTATPVELKPAAKEPIVLRLHMRAGTEKSEEVLYVGCPGNLAEKYPHIKVELAPIPAGEYEAKIQTMVAARTLGDVLHSSGYTGYHRRLMRQGVIAVSDEQLDAHGISKKEWLPAAVDALTLDGKMYGLPKNLIPGYAFIWVNLDMGVQALFAAKKVAMWEGSRAMCKSANTALEQAGNPFRWTVIGAAREAKHNPWIAIVAAHSATTFTKYPEEAFLVSYAMADAPCA